MNRHFHVTLLFCSAVLLTGCGRHWVQGEARGDIPSEPNLPIIRSLGMAELRRSLLDCMKRNAAIDLHDLDSVRDDQLASWGQNGELAFNQCMSAKGWISVPDVLLAP